jgi:transcriptional regulator with XRE-family HTH domain
VREIQGGLFMNQGTVLKQLRMNEGMTYFDLARASGVREGILSTIERGMMVGYPKYRRLLSEYFHVPESELFDSRGFALTVRR